MLTGYRTALVLVKTSHGITKDDVIQSVKEFGDLAYHVHHMGSTSVAALIIKEPLDEKIIQSLNERLKPATVVSISVTELSVAASNDKRNRFEINKMSAAIRCQDRDI